VAVADDDTYVFQKTLFRDMQTWSGPMMYLGEMMDNQPVIHARPGDENSKYGEHNFPTKDFPRYASGIFFVLSVDAIQPFISTPLPLHEMTNDDAQVGTVLLPYNVTYEKRPGIMPWGHHDKQKCIQANDFYCIHTTPHYAKSWIAYEVMVLGLHRNLTAGRCVMSMQDAD
jgi:Galactosyltransferase